MPVGNYMSPSEVEKLAYEVLGEYGISGRRLFTKGGYARTHNVHTFQIDDLTNIFRHIAFRDFMRTHPDIAKTYGELKEKAALAHPDDIDGYMDEKDGFVKKYEKEAIKLMLNRF